MKKCIICEESKTIENFYKHPQMPDGYLNKCKECAKKQAKENYHRKAQDLDWVLKERERTRERFHRLNYGDKYSPKGEDKRKSISKYYDTHPLTKQAKNITSNAIKYGKLIKQPCEICGELKVQAHHEDYSKPLEVRWLCIKHHNERHVELRRLQLLNSFVPKETLFG